MNDFHDRCIRVSLVWLEDHWKTQGIQLRVIHITEDTKHRIKAGLQGKASYSGTTILLTTNFCLFEAFHTQTAHMQCSPATVILWSHRIDIDTGKCVETVIAWASAASHGSDSYVVD